MPKAKPTQVIVHRIEAGAWERENILRPVSRTAETARLITAGAAIIGALGVAGAAYVLYHLVAKLYGVFDEGIGDKVKRAVLQQIPVIKQVDDFNIAVGESAQMNNPVSQSEWESMSYWERFQYNLGALYQYADEKDFYGL